MVNVVVVLFERALQLPVRRNIGPKLFLIGLVLEAHLPNVVTTSFKLEFERAPESADYTCDQDCCHASIQNSS